MPSVILHQETKYGWLSLRIIGKISKVKHIIFIVPKKREKKLVAVCYEALVSQFWSLASLIYNNTNVWPAATLTRSQHKFCRDYSLGVIIALSAAPGSQNGFHTNGSRD